MPYQSIINNKKQQNLPPIQGALAVFTLSIDPKIFRKEPKKIFSGFLILFKLPKNNDKAWDCEEAFVWEKEDGFQGFFISAQENGRSHVHSKHYWLLRNHILGV